MFEYYFNRDTQKQNKVHIYNLDKFINQKVNCFSLASFKNVDLPTPKY